MRIHVEKSRICHGRFANLAGKRAAYCLACKRVDYEANEGDRCGSRIRLPADCPWCRDDALCALCAGEAERRATR